MKNIISLATAAFIILMLGLSFEEPKSTPNQWILVGERCRPKGQIDYVFQYNGNEYIGLYQIIRKLNSEGHSVTSLSENQTQSGGMTVFRAILIVD